MRILQKNNITCFDVDGTLVIWPKNYHDKKTQTIEFRYGDEFIYLHEHVPHVTFLKHCHNRGDYVSVWSQNGWEWALQVIEKLGLRDYVDEVRSKPSRHVDDKDYLADIVGNRIFMKYEPEEK